MYPNMCAKFGCGPTVVSKKGGGTDRQTKGHCSFIVNDALYFQTGSVNSTFSQYSFGREGVTKRVL